MDRTNRQLFLQASTTSHLVGRIVEAQLEQVGIPAFLLALLTHVRDLQPVSPTAVALASGAPPTTLRDNIQRLVDRRLVRRVPNPDDGRSYLLVLTRRGEIAIRAADPALLEAYLALEERLPRPRRDYELMLDELNDALEGARAALEAPAPARTRGEAETSPL
jgi:DNA-binding MarR family transcriptional regulator